MKHLFHSRKYSLLLAVMISLFALATLTPAQTAVQPSTWYEIGGGAQLGVTTQPKALENFFGTKYTFNLSGYSGSNIDGIPGVGALLSTRAPLWKGGGVDIGVAGGWTQSKKLAGRVVISFAIPL